MEILDIIFEIIGTVAFAVSGALVAIDKKMDLLGVAVLGTVTAVGGGILRDLCLGITPPTAFVRPYYTILAAAVSIIIFALPIREKIKGTLYFDKTLLIMDSAGLGAFAMVGIHVAYVNNAGSFTMLMVGTFTGVAGGVFRDMLSNQMPYIFVKHFYCTAVLIGTLISIILLHFIPEAPALIVGALIIIVLRLLAAKYRWSLPHA